MHSLAPSPPPFSLQRSSSLTTQASVNLRQFCPDGAGSSPLDSKRLESTASSNSHLIGFASMQTPDVNLSSQSSNSALPPLPAISAVHTAEDNMSQSRLPALSSCPLPAMPSPQPESESQLTHLETISSSIAIPHIRGVLPPGSSSSSPPPPHSPLLPSFRHQEDRTCVLKDCMKETSRGHTFFPGRSNPSEDDLLSGGDLRAWGSSDARCSLSVECKPREIPISRSSEGASHFSSYVCRSLTITEPPSPDRVDSPSQFLPQTPSISIDCVNENYQYSRPSVDSGSPLCASFPVYVE